MQDLQKNTTKIHTISQFHNPHANAENRAKRMDY